MLLSTSNLLQLVNTGASANIDWVVRYEEYTVASGLTTFNVATGNISSATTTTLVAAPASGTYRKITYLSIFNNSATLATAKVQYYTSSTAYNTAYTDQLSQFYSLVWTPESGWNLHNDTGAVVMGSPGVSTFSGGTTGLTPATATSGAITLAGTLAIANGGTGATTAAGAMTALSPITTTGDIIYSSSGTTNSRLAIGTTGQVLEVIGGVPAWTSVKFTPTICMASGDNNTYYFTLYATFPFTINGAYYQTTAGSITGNVKIAGTSVTGLSALSFTTSAATHSTATAANTVSVGNNVSITFTSNSSATYPTITLDCTRTG